MTIDRAALATFNSGVALAAQAYYARESEPVDPGPVAATTSTTPNPTREPADDPGAGPVVPSVRARTEQGRRLPSERRRQD